MNKLWCATCREQAQAAKPVPASARKRTTSPAVRGRTRGKMAERYQAQLKFMHNLTRERRSLFDRMVLADMDEARMVRLYFGLDGQAPMSQRDVAAQFGLRQSTVSLIINAVLMVLDPSQPGSQAARDRSESLSRRLRDEGLV